MKKEKTMDQYIKDNWAKDNVILAKELGVSESTIRRHANKLGLTSKKNTVVPSKVLIQQDREKISYQESKKTLDKKYKYLLDENQRLDKELNASLLINQPIKTKQLALKADSGNSEVVAVVLASDWHIEETVDPKKVNGKNCYNLAIAEKRAEQFFQNTLKLVKKEQKAAKIDTLVLALLGDFISGNIHDELLENCSLRPIEAMLKVQSWITSGIEFLLKNSELNLIIPCHVGNHTRITKKVHISTEQGNSLETFTYHSMKNYFLNSKYANRVDFRIADGYLQIVDVYNYKIRFHHGHGIKYGGGIGGIFIPAYKAISQWQKLDYADLDCFGHLHQTKDGGNFLCNGSMIGYNAFAVMIKGDYEKPKQTFFLIDKKRGRTGTFPIVFDC